MIIKKLPVSNDYLLDNKATSLITEEVLKCYLLERQPIYFKYKEKQHTYYTEIKIYYGQMAMATKCHLGYEGEILLDQKTHEGKYIGLWSTRNIACPTLPDAYECFLNSLLSIIS
jgi:hypothetical protein